MIDIKKIKDQIKELEQSGRIYPLPLDNSILEDYYIESDGYSLYDFFLELANKEIAQSISLNRHGYIEIDLPISISTKNISAKIKFNDKLIFQKLVSILSKDNEDIPKIWIQGCTFNGFDCSTIKLLHCEEAKFKGDMKLSFGKNFNKVSFYNSIFECPISFKEANITDCNFSLTEFHQEAYFNGAHFYENNTFEFTEFRSQGAFYGATFHSNPRFHNLILKDTSHLYFEGLNPEQKDKEQGIPQFALTNTVINGRIDFSENIIKSLDMRGSTVVGILTRTNFNPKCVNWETACLLKDEELKRNNTIQALKYKAQEKELHYQYLCQEKKALSDRFILWLGRWFHNHGQDWKQALFWTIAFWIGSFTCFYIPSPFLYHNPVSYLNSIRYIVSSGEFFSKLFEYFSILDYSMLSDYIKGDTPYWWIKIIGSFWFLIGRITIYYGIYETIKAFRKFDKI